ncbi:MAG: hypothetical protein WCO56_09305 [Verrucomicrobiota bacterium]
MPIRSTIRRHVRRIVRVLHRTAASTAQSSITKLVTLRDRAESALNLLRAKPLPEDFNTLFLDHLKLRLLEFILQPSPSPAMLLKYFELWAKYLAKTSGSDAKPPLPLHRGEAGIRPETFAYIEKELKLM